MKQLWENVMDGLRRFAKECYGLDELSDTMYITALVLVFISIVPHCRIFYYVSLILVFITVFRVSSKNFERRKQERETYLGILCEAKKFILMQQRCFRDRKVYKYFKCPNCRTYHRVPKGYGHIMISCSKCRRRFEVKS